MSDNLSSNSNIFKKYIRITTGIIFILAIPLWLYIGIPEQLEIPDNFSLKTEVNSFDNFYNTDTKSFEGEQRSITTFSYKSLGGDSEKIKIENSFNVRTLTGQPIFSVHRIYGIDAHTGMHVPGIGDKDRNGYLFAPRMKGMAAQAKDKSSFSYWHVNYNTPALMSYRDETTLYGLHLYRYVANLIADQTKELTGVLPEVGKSKGIGLDVNLELWVEPYTGRIIQYKDQTNAYFYNLETKDKLEPWNSFRNQTDTLSASEQAKNTSILKQKINLLTFGISLLLLLFGVLCLTYPYLKKIIRIITNRTNNTGKIFLLPIIATVGVLIFTLFLTFVAARITRQQTEADFYAEINKIEENIADRLSLYANVLKGGRGLFDASNEVSRDEWKAYIESLTLQKDYPGIQGIGFSKVVKPDEKEQFIKSVKDEGFSDFTVTPTGEREIYTSIIYLEPFDERNQRAFGFDMFSEPIRREAMTNARDTNKTSISKKVTLLQENTPDKQAGFLMYEAVHKPKESIYGYVYAPFRMNNFMSGILSEESTNLKIEIFDGPNKKELSEDRLMYQNDIEISNPLYASIKTIGLYNQYWTIRFSAPGNYHYDILRNSIPILVLTFGILLSILLFSVMYVINTRRAKAVSLAEDMTSDLKNSKQEIEEKVKIAERLNAVMVDRELKMVELKEEIKKLHNEK